MAIAIIGENICLLLLVNLQFGTVGTTNGPKLRFLRIKEWWMTLKPSSLKLHGHRKTGGLFGIGPTDNDHAEAYKSGCSSWTY